jgi:hypothetical protein
MTQRLAANSVLAENLIDAVSAAQRLDAKDQRRLPLTRDERPAVKRRRRIKLQYWAQGAIR